MSLLTATLFAMLFLYCEEKNVETSGEISGLECSEEVYGCLLYGL